REGVVAGGQRSEGADDVVSAHRARRRGGCGQTWSTSDTTGRERLFVLKASISGSKAGIRGIQDLALVVGRDRQYSLGDRKRPGHTEGRIVVGVTELPGADRAASRTGDMKCAAAESAAAAGRG